MYSKVSPLRILIASMLGCLMVLLFIYTRSTTPGLTAGRFFGIGLSAVGIGIACIILSLKEVFLKNGEQPGIKEIQRMYLWFEKYNVRYISTGDQILTAEQFVHLIQIRWLNWIGEKFFLFGAIGIVISVFKYFF